MFLFAGVLPWKLNDILGHFTLLSLFFIEALQLVLMMYPTTHSSQVYHKTGAWSHQHQRATLHVPISLPPSGLRSASPHHPLPSSLLPHAARNQAGTPSPLTGGLSVHLQHRFLWAGRSLISVCLDLASIWPHHTIKEVSKAQLYYLKYKTFKLNSGIDIIYSHSMDIYIDVPFTKSTPDILLLPPLLIPSY